MTSRCFVGWAEPAAAQPKLGGGCSRGGKGTRICYCQAVQMTSRCFVGWAEPAAAQRTLGGGCPSEDQRQILVERLLSPAGEQPLFYGLSRTSTANMGRGG